MSTLLISLALVGCSNNSNSKSKDPSSKDAKSEKIASSKKKAESESKKKAESKSKAKTASAASQKSTQAISSIQQQNQGPDFSLSLTDFVNKYGMSPAAYRITKMGMSEKQALYATPDYQQSSGEIQKENQYKNEQGNSVDSNTQNDTTSGQRSVIDDNNDGVPDGMDPDEYAQDEGYDSYDDMPQYEKGMSGGNAEKFQDAVDHGWIDENGNPGENYDDYQ